VLHKFLVVIVKKFLKSVYIYRSYRQNKPGGVRFFEHPVCVCVLCVEALSFDDFCDICRKEPATTEEDLMKAFRKIDVNGDGFISNSELRKMLTTVKITCFLACF